jgi:hypothetical protein
VNYALIGVSVFLFLLALPLVLGWVEPNPVYGVRFRRTMEEPLWYPVNKFGGQAVCVAALLSIAVSFFAAPLDSIHVGLDWCLSCMFNVFAAIAAYVKARMLTRGVRT